MRKDCKMEAKDFANPVEELAYTVGQVCNLVLTLCVLACLLFS